jgi:hypothetical protein
MFQIILMNIRVMQKAQETKSRNTRYQSEKHLLLKDYDITMNILKNIAQKTFDCKFQGSSKRIREDKKNLMLLVLVFYFLQHVQPKLPI